MDRESLSIFFGISEFKYGFVAHHYLMASPRERRARIDAEIEQLEAQLDAQERAEKKGGEVLEVELARCGGSYVLQKVKCGKPICRCARAGGELHGPYWYLYWKKDGKTKSRYVGKERPAKGLQRPGPQL